MSGGRRRRLGRPPNLPRRRPERAEVDLADVQGNVLRGYTMPAAAYVWVHVVDAAKTRALLGRMLEHVVTAAPWDDAAPATAINVALTHSGLRALGVGEPILASFPDVFRQGMASRARRLGDRGPSAPANWEAGFGTGEAHLLATVHAVDAPTLDATLDSILRSDTEGGVALVHLQRAEALSGDVDHFGFFDGISQPAFAGAGVGGRPGDGQPDGAGSWRDVALGEVLLGYVDEDGTLPAAPAPPFDRNATYVVYRKLAMDTAAFRRFVTTAGYPGGAEALAAKFVGRWRDGTPLAVSPLQPDAAISRDPARINDFSYADDPVGVRCPVGAHIRRANPRDAPGFFDGRLTNRHRIVRRGRSYGTPLAPGAFADDGVERGLVFVCFQADIWRQFETIQALWIDDGDPFGLGTDKDFLVGEPHGTAGKMTIQGAPPFFLKPQPRFVTLRGGEYLFQPSMTALRRLADGGV